MRSDALEAVKGRDYLERGGARWTHTACAAHRSDGGDGTGHNPKCEPCVATARDTIAHIKAVEANG